MAWVSATAAAESATTTLLHARPVASAGLLHERGTLERRVNQRSKDIVGAVQKRIGGVDVDGTHHGSHAPTGRCAPGVGDELVEQIADAARANGSGPRLEPGQIVLVQRHRYCALSHTI